MDIKAEKRLSEYNDIIKENENVYRGLAKRLKLPECAFWILYVLRSGNAALTQSEICCALYQPKQTVNSSLKNLEAEGYINLGVAKDRRSRLITLTGKGVELAKTTVDKVIAAEKGAMLALSEEEQKAFISLFQKYTGALKKQAREIGETNENYNR